MTEEQIRDISFNSTLVVGLGGTGQKTILHLKKTIKEIYGEREINRLSYLAIDTDDREELEYDDEFIKIEMNEFHHCTVDDPGRLVRSNENISEWYSGSKKIKPISKGAHQSRSCGRLAIWGGSADEIYDKIQSKINGLRALGKTKGYGYINESPSIRVFLVGSLAGGTGSGMFMDVGALIRCELEEYDIFSPIFLLPGIFEDIGNNSRVFANTYGALREIEFMFREEFEYPGEWILARKDLKQVIFHQNDGLIFDYVLLIDNTNKSNKKINNKTDMFEAIAHGIYVLSTAAGDKAISSFDNNEQDEEKIHGNIRKYGSFGVSTLEFPQDWYLEKYKKEISVDILDRDFFSNSSISDELYKYKNFIISNKIEEQGSKDQVLDSIFKDISLDDEICPEEIDDEEIDDMINLYRDGLKNEELRLKGIAEKKSDELYIRINDALKGKIAEFFKMKLNIHNIIDFLTRLRNYFTICKDELIEGRIKIDNNYKVLQGGLDEIVNSIKTAGDSFFMFRSKKILDKFQVYINRLNSIKSAKIKSLKNEYAVHFFINIEKIITDELEKIANFKEKFEKMKFDLESEVTKKGKQRIEKLLTIEIRPDEFENMKYDLPDSLVEWKKDNYSDNLEKYTDKDNLLIFSEKSASIEKLKNTSITMAMDSLKNDPEKFNEVYKRFKGLAEPLWNCDNVEMVNNQPAENNIISCDDHEKMRQIFDDVVNENQTYSNSYDKKRIYMCNFEAYSPVFSVNIVKDLDEDYKSIRKSQDHLAFHLHKKWDEDSDILPDLYQHDRMRTKKNPKYWYLGICDSLGNIISREEKSSYYYVTIKHETKSNEDIKLGQGKFTALEKFQSSPKIRNYVSNLVDNKIKLEANDLMKKLKTEYEELEVKLGKKKKKTSESYIYLDDYITVLKTEYTKLKKLVE